jgi:hypothetical protein
VPQKRILRVEAVEAPAFERVVFDVAATALLLAVFLRAARLRRQRGEAPVRGEREIDIVAVGIEEARAHHGRFEIVAADDRRHAAEIAEGALVQPEKRLELLIPDRVSTISCLWQATRRAHSAWRLFPQGSTSSS